MRKNGVYRDAQDVQVAVNLIRLGARMQLLASELDLPRERLLKLYKEICGTSPPKGMLPFSTEWFLSWRANVHASLFAAIYEFLSRDSKLLRLELLVKSYQIYLHQVQVLHLHPVLSITRAWTLLRFFDAQMMETVTCQECSGRFVVHKLDMNRNYVCGQCEPPRRMKGQIMAEVEVGRPH